MSENPICNLEGRCIACNAVLEKVANIPGFVSGQTFPVYQCLSCLSQVTYPLTVPDGLYEAIYQAGEGFGGYARYHRHAKIVARLRKPLKYLHYAEAPYWAVIEALKESPPGALRILEIGCGLGYLTAALRKAGYEAWGIDLSEEAVAIASARFGPWYQAGSSIDNALDRLNVGKQFSMIVALELIEHVPDPAGLLSEMTHFLEDDGEILISTPNRSSSPKSAVWNTELPPVHLHWFSEDGITRLGEILGLSSRLIDFTFFNRLHGLSSRSATDFPMHASLLTEEMKPNKIGEVKGFRFLHHLFDLPGSEYILAIRALRWASYTGALKYGPRNTTLSVRYRRAAQKNS